MKCKGNFKFKELKKVDAGTFTNKETGEVISYNESFKLKVDEISENGINERIFKILPENTQFLNALRNAKPYDNIELEFDLVLYANGVKLSPINCTLIK